MPRRTGLWFAVALLLFGSAAAQELEFTIPIPESLGKPGQAVFASVERKLYCYLTDSGRLAVIDPETREITGVVPLGRGLDVLQYSRRWQRLYCSGDSGLVFLRTTDDDVVFVRRDWGRTTLVVEPAGSRVFVYSGLGVLRVLEATAGATTDSLLGIGTVSHVCFDPLRQLLWGRGSGLVDCTDRLRFIGPVPAYACPTYNPWDGLVYALGNGIYRINPLTLAAERWLPVDSVGVSGLLMNAPDHRLYYEQQWHYGSMVYHVRTVSFPERVVTVCAQELYRSGNLHFVPVGKRVWFSNDLDWCFACGERLESPQRFDSLGLLLVRPGFDPEMQRTFVTDRPSRRISVYGDALRDSSDLAAALVVGPTAVVDTAAGCALRATIVNIGIYNRDVPVFLRVHMPDSGGVRRASDFADTVMVSLDGYDWGVAAFDTWHPSAEGEYVAEVTVAWPEDVNAANDTARCAIRVVGACRDVELTSIASPQGVVVRGDSLLPAAWVRNLSSGAGTCPVVMCIGSTYVDTQHVTVNGGSRAAVVFRPWLPLDTGKFTARCSAMLAGDTVPANNSVAIPVQVVLPGGVDTSESLPALLSAGDWYPNPARSGAQLRYELPQTVSVRAVVYSSNGRLVRTVADGVQSAGYHNLAWDGCDDFGRRCGAGVYFCHVRAGPVEKSTKLTLLR